MTLFRDKETVRLLNACDGKFFVLVQSMLSDSIVLSLCRITDHPGKGKLTLDRLLETPGNHGRTKNLIGKAKDATKEIRTIRNERVAHTVVNQTLPSIKWDDYKEAVNAVHAVLDEHSQIHRGSVLSNPLEQRYAFDDVGDFLSVLKVLVEVLRFTKKYLGDDLTFRHIDRYTTDDAARIQHIDILASQIEHRMAD